MCYTKSMSIFMTYSVAKCLVIDIVYWQRNNVKMTNGNRGHKKNASQFLTM